MAKWKPSPAQIEAIAAFGDAIAAAGGKRISLPPVNGRTLAVLEREEVVEHMDSDGTWRFRTLGRELYAAMKEAAPVEFPAEGARLYAKETGSVLTVGKRQGRRGIWVTERDSGFLTTVDYVSEQLACGAWEILTPARWAQMCAEAHYSNATSEDTDRCWHLSEIYRASEKALIDAIEVAYPDVLPAAVIDVWSECGESIGYCVSHLRTSREEEAWAEHLYRIEEATERTFRLSGMDESTISSVLNAGYVFANSLHTVSEYYSAAWLAKWRSRVDTGYLNWSNEQATVLIDDVIMFKGRAYVCESEEPVFLTPFHGMSGRDKKLTCPPSGARSFMRTGAWQRATTNCGTCGPRVKAECGWCKPCDRKGAFLSAPPILLGSVPAPKACVKLPEVTEGMRIWEPALARECRVGVTNSLDTTLIYLDHSSRPVGTAWLRGELANGNMEIIDPKEEAAAEATVSVPCVVAVAPEPYPAKVRPAMSSKVKSGLNRRKRKAAKRHSVKGAR